MCKSNCVEMHHGGTFTEKTEMNYIEMMDMIDVIFLHCVHLV